MTSRYTRKIDTPDLERSRAGLIHRDGLRRQAQTLLHVKDGRKHNEQHRTCWCGRHIVGEGVMPVMRSLDGAKARVGSISSRRSARPGSRKVHRLRRA